MPKLNKSDAAEVEQSEALGGSFEPLKPGKYLGTLVKVEARQTQKGDPAWNLEFDSLTTLDGEKVPGRQWLNINLPQAKMPAHYDKGAEKWEQYQSMCRGRLKQFFDAFGYTTDSDTDEMLGETVVLVIGVTTIRQGPRQGEKTNSVNSLEPLPEGVVIEKQAVPDDDF